MRLKLAKGIPYLFAGLVTFFLFQFPLEGLKFYISDQFIKYSLDPFDTQKVSVVMINSKTVQALGREPRLEEWNQVLSNILKQQPRGVLITKPLARWQDDEEAIQASFIEWSTESLQRFRDIVVGNPVYQQTDRLFLKGNLERESLAPPFDFLPTLSAPRTTDQALFAGDGATRRILVSYQGQELGHPFLASLVNPEIQNLKNIQGKFSVYDSEQIWIDYIRSHHFKPYAFESLISEQGLADSPLKGQIVVIGEDLGKSLRDYVKTPFSKDPSAMTLTEMHAQAIATLVRNSAVHFVGHRWVMGFTLVLCFLVMGLSFHGKPFWGFLSVFGFILILGAVNYILFNMGRMQIPLAHPVLAIVASYYVLLPYRLLIEQRRTWEAQQKNKILAQVEELKTNFISMMSHDLKTPIARIQGMTDVIVQDPQPLTSKQREAIDFIRSSSEDLLRVLSAILNYARIESEGVDLHRVSRDINALLEEVISKHQFLAKLKQIQILFEPETLFPILIDADLLRQVFSNLIENAIKYSPEGTKVLVTTEELDGFVRVQVSDQGAGIATEDLPFIFSKFYRGAGAKASTVKGSGLGLYLTKYFIELHHGKISVESEVNLGTTFTVDLPIHSDS